MAAARSPSRSAAACCAGVGLLLAFLSAAVPVLAGRVVSAVPRHLDGWLVVDVRTTDLLDDRTRSTVESGLPGSCLLLVELRDESDAVAAARAIERSLTFDLWEDLVRLVEGAQERSFPGLAAADSAWSRFDAVRLAPWSSLAGQTQYRLHVKVRVQPLGAEERERVSRWVSQSERDERREFAIDVGGLVRRFMRGAADESDAEVWRGAAFTLRALAGSAAPEEPDP